MVTKTSMKNYLFLYHYLLDECCNAFIYMLCEVSVFTHYGDYTKNNLFLPLMGSRWQFGCHSVFPFLPELIQSSYWLSKAMHHVLRAFYEHTKLLKANWQVQ